MADAKNNQQSNSIGANTRAFHAFKSAQHELALCLVSIQDITPPVRAALSALVHHYNDKTSACFPEQDTIARWCGVKRRQVINILDDAESAGFFTRRVRGFKKSCQYDINIDAFRRRAGRLMSATDCTHEAAAASAMCATNEAHVCNTLHGMSATDCTVTGFSNGLKEREEEQAPAIEPAFSPLPSSYFEEQTEQPAVVAAAVPAAPAAVVPVAAPAELLDAATLAAVNAQRAGNGKRSGLDVQELAAEAEKAGITAAAAAAWVLAKQGRNFFRADYYRPEDAPAAAELMSESERAAARARAEALTARRLAESVARMGEPTQAAIAAPVAFAGSAKAAARALRDRLKGRHVSPAAAAVVVAAHSAGQIRSSWASAGAALDLGCLVALSGRPAQNRANAHMAA